MTEEQFKKLETDILGLKTDLVWLTYLVERMDEKLKQNISPPPPEAPEDPYKNMQIFKL